MNKTIIASLIGLLSVNSYAEEKILSTGDIVVTASLSPQKASEALSDISIISPADIERAGQSTLIELLGQQPGVEFSSSGGMGSTSYLFLRGTNDRHTLILIDGLRVESVSAGTTTIENIPLSQIDHIEILRGAASSLYGADAIGGVIQIFTKKANEGFKLSASAGYGTYNTRKGDAYLAWGNESTRIALNASEVATDGFNFTKKSTGLSSDKDAYRNQSITANISHEYLAGHTLSAQVLQYDGHVNFDDSSNLTTRPYTDTMQRGISLQTKDQFLTNWLSTLRIGQGIDDSKSIDSSNSTFRTNQNQLFWQNDITLPIGVLTLAYDYAHIKLSTDQGFAKTTRSNNGLLASYLVNVEAHSMQLSLRNDDNSQYGSHTTGGVSYGYRFNSEWRASSSYATAFKAPSFDFLYYPGPYSNPDLKAETSKNKEISLRYETQNLNADLTVFRNDLKNLIVNDAVFHPSNIGEANITGLALNGEWKLDSLRLRANATTQSAENASNHSQLQLRAHEFGNFSALYQLGKLELGAEIYASGKRYDSSDGTNKLAGYSLVNLTASYGINQEWKIESRANNILDRDYTLKNGYNTPGANVFVSLRYSPNN